MNGGTGERPAVGECEAAVRAMYDYLDSRLAAPDATRVSSHLETCRACAAHYTFARRLLDQLPAALPLTDAPQELRLRITSALSSAGYAPASTRGGNSL
jgi:anti-sigma factor RsiW